MPRLHHRVRRVAFTSLLTVAVVFVVAREASADPPPPPASADAPAPSDEDLKRRNDIVNLLRRDLVFATLQILPAARGGTLGIPSSAPIDGFQVGLDTQVIAEKAALLAQLGGLTVSPHVDADVFGEVMQQDLPRYEQGDAVTLRSPTTALSTAGLRIRYRYNPVVRVYELQHTECLELVHELQAATDKAAARALAPKVYRSCGPGKLAGRSWWEFSAGARVLRRSALESGGNASNGAAGELMVSYTSDSPSHSHVGFVGASGMRIERSADTLGTQVVDYPTFRSLRGSAGYEFRGSYAADDHDFLPRVGAYAVVTHAWWDDPGATGMSKSTARNEIEVGAYLAGRFQKSFQGIVAIRMVKSFGDEGTAFVLSLIPSAASGSSTVTK